MGVLKAKVGGTWVEIPGVAGGGFDVPGTLWTPVLTQSVTVPFTQPVACTYVRMGRMVFCQGNLAVTGTGTALNGIKVSIPVPARFPSFALMGIAQVYDASAAYRYVCIVVPASATTIAFGSDGASTDLLGASPSFALASGDAVNFNLTYEAA